MHFDTKSYLKSTRNHTDKHALNDIAVHQVWLGGCWTGLGYVLGDKL